MNNSLARAQLLLAQSRFELAEEAARKAVIENPNESAARAALAVALLGQKKYLPATHEAQEAIRLQPNLPYAHFVTALVFLERDRYADADKAIREAIRLDPEDADFWSVAARIGLVQERWQAALDAAEQGLALDAENVECLNARTFALTQLGRRDEAFQSVDEALARDPDNAEAHLSRGWAYLHNGQPDKALDHFRETLRIDPTMDAARAGIVEALKARNFLYRIMLQYFLWMSRLGGRARWFVIIGFYVLARLLRGVAKSNPDWAPFIWPVLGLYTVFVLLTWTASPMFNLLLRLNKFGRLALDREDIIASNLVGACVGGVVLSLLLYLATRIDAFGIAALGFFLMVIPVAAVFSCPKGWPRTAMAWYTTVTGASGVIAAVVLAIASGLSKEERRGHPLNVVFLFSSLLFVLGVLAASWVGIILSRQTVRK